MFSRLEGDAEVVRARHESRVNGAAAAQEEKKKHSKGGKDKQQRFVFKKYFIISFYKM